MTSAKTGSDSSLHRSSVKDERTGSVRKGSAVHLRPNDVTANERRHSSGIDSVSVTSHSSGGRHSNLSPASSLRSLDSGAARAGTPTKSQGSLAGAQSSSTDIIVTTTLPASGALSGVPPSDSTAHLRKTSIKMMPSLPVTTATTRQLTSQTQVAEELNRLTLRRMKKSVSGDQDFELPPPPPPLDSHFAPAHVVPPAGAGAAQQGMPSPGFPPPPPDLDFDASNVYEVISSRTSDVSTHAPAVAPKPSIEERYDVSGYMTVRSASKKSQQDDATLKSRPRSSEQLGFSPGFAANQYQMLSAHGTIRKAPPTLPKRRPETAVQAQGTQARRELVYASVERAGDYRNVYGSNVRGFVSDLSRVVQDKHDAMQATPIVTSSAQYDTISRRPSLQPPPPPPPRTEAVDGRFVPEDLPPPPAELLEELKLIRRQLPARNAPLPPRRTVTSHAQSTR